MTSVTDFWPILLGFLCGLAVVRLFLYEKESIKKIPLVAPLLLSPKESSPRITSTVGSLHCYVGPMFSGKTSTMITHVVRYADITMSSRPLIMNHIIDKDRAVGNGDL